MDTFEALREDFAGAFTAINDYAQAQRRHAEAVSAEVKRLWQDNAELRDEINAVANRVESLTRLATPAEVAAAIVNDANRSTLREVRHEWAFCRECNTHHSFTEGKCDFCSAPIVGVGEKL